jgi:TonB family protein
MVRGGIVRYPEYDETLPIHGRISMAKDTFNRPHVRSMGGKLTRITAALSIALLPLLGWPAEPEWPQSLYMPGITVSASVGDTTPGKEVHKRVLGRCDILIWVTADGYIRVAQVIRSTGHARLDDACLHAVMGGKKLIPAEDPAGPIDRWAIIPVTWEAMMAKEPNPPDRLMPSAPLAPNQSLHVKPSDYPKGALERAEQGQSWVHVDVSDSGQVLDVKIAKSSGSNELDNAALDAIRGARFSPAFSDHKPIQSGSDVVVAWLLPDSSHGGTASDQH